MAQFAKKKKRKKHKMVIPFNRIILNSFIILCSECDKQTVSMLRNSMYKSRLLPAINVANGNIRFGFME